MSFDAKWRKVQMDHATEKPGGYHSFLSFFFFIFFGCFWAVVSFLAVSAAEINGAVWTLSDTLGMQNSHAISAVDL